MHGAADPRRAVARGDGDDAAIVHRVARIDGEIEDRELQRVRIGSHRRDVVRHIDRNAHIDAQAAVQQIVHACEIVGQRDRLRD